jgi:ABC-type Fe3+/spermidine/putrescine transport system ATPase subunit
MTETALELRDVCKRFGQTVTADHVSLAVARGEFFTLLGPSGSGKSTILRMIAGLERPDAGKILIGGSDMTLVPPWRRHLGMVFQRYAIFPHMNVAGNVGYGLRARRTPVADRDREVGRMLDLVGLSGMESKDVTVLSGGEQQRVALARSLIMQPSLILLDEPLSALDEKIRREMQTELKHIQQKTGTTFIYVTHDQEEALTMSDRIAVLNRGVCVQCDRPEHLFRHPRTRFVATFFRGCNVLDAGLVAAEPGRVAIRLGEAVAPVPLDGAKPAEGAASVGIAIRAEHLYLGRHAADCAHRTTATVEEIVYRGTNVDHVLRLPDGQHLTATSTRREADRAGGHITVGFSAEDLVLLDD